MNLLIFFALFHILFLTASVAQSNRPLEGLKLRCCTIIESPIVFEGHPGKHAHRFAGIAIDYLDILEDKLGFQCETLKLFKANKPENQGFTGFVMELEKCTRRNGTTKSSPKCQCDIGVGGWVLNQERMGRADFPPSFINDDFRMLTHIDNINPESAGSAFFITAFSVTTWIAVFGLIASFIFLKLFDRRFAPADTGFVDLPADATWYARFKGHLLESRLPKRLQNATKGTLLEIIGQSMDDSHGDSQTNRQWLITYILFLCGLFLVLAYEATMTASLIQEVATSEFRSIDDLKTCRIRAEEICIPDGGAALAFWEGAVATSPCNQAAPQPTIVHSYKEGNQKVANKECKYFLASGATTRDAAHGRYCGQVVTTGEPFFLTSYSFVLPRGSNLTKVFSSMTLELRELDVVDSLEKFLRKRGECETGEQVTLTFGRLKIFFVMSFSACAFMFLVMVVYPQGKKKRQKTRELDVTNRNVEPDQKVDGKSESSSFFEEV